jgi:hypothetical protein
VIERWAQAGDPEAKDAQGTEIFVHLSPENAGKSQVEVLE